MAVFSEIGRLRRVLVHRPGREVEGMTPSTAQDLLYNDIVPVEAVQREHDQLRAVLTLVSDVIELEDVLAQAVHDRAGRRALAGALAGVDPRRLDALLRRWDPDGPGDATAERDQGHNFRGEPVGSVVDDCVQGVERIPSRLTDLIATERFVTPPLPNLYFTRDSGFVVGEQVFRSAMASTVRDAESALAETVLAALGYQVSRALRTTHAGPSSVTVEGGDVLVINRDTLLLGLGARSTAAGLDLLLEEVSRGRDRPLTALVVRLPDQRATIHLDMIATMIDHNLFLGYEPMVSGGRALAVHGVHIDPGEKEWRFREYGSLATALEAVSPGTEIVSCGGSDPVVREREQWFSACNSVALAPGHIVVYRNNPATLEALSQAGFSVHTGDEVIADRSLILGAGGDPLPGRFAVAVDGVELARGGGGPRCMTMPLNRETL